MSRVAILCATVFLLAACSGSTSQPPTGYVHPQFFDQSQRLAFVYDDPISAALAGELGARGFRLVERAALMAVVDEQALNQSGLLQEDKFIRAGKIANVRFLVAVTEQLTPNRARPMWANIKIVDVQTAEVVGSVSYTNGKRTRSLWTVLFWPLLLMHDNERGGDEQRVDTNEDAARRIAEVIISMRAASAQR